MESRCRYCCRETGSFSNDNWTQVQISPPEDGRHGCIIPITEEEYQAISALGSE